MLRLLARLEASPTASFAEEELLRDYRDEFDSLRRLGVVQEVPPPDASFRCTVEGTNYIATRDGDGYVAVEADEGEPQVVRLTESQVRRWAVDLPALARAFQRESDLEGPLERISERSWLLGRLDDSTGVLLGLYRDPDVAEAELAAATSRMPSSVKSLVVACPTLKVSSLVEARLEDSHIAVINLRENDGLRFSGFSRLKNGATSAFSHSDDYMTLWVHGRRFVLNEQQAAAIKTLDELPPGSGGMKWSTLKARLQLLGVYAERMRDLFRSVEDWHLLFDNLKNGMYRLNK